MLLGRDIGPEVPRAHTNLLTDVVDAEDGTSRVGASNDEGLSNTLDGLVDKHADESLPLTLNIGNIDLAILDEAINERGLANGAGNDYGLCGIRIGVCRAGEGLLV